MGHWELLRKSWWFMLYFLSSSSIRSKWRKWTSTLKVLKVLIKASAQLSFILPLPFASFWGWRPARFTGEIQADFPKTDLKRQNDCHIQMGVLTSVIAKKDLNNAIPFNALSLWFSWLVESLSSSSWQISWRMKNEKDRKNILY